jgi:membrane protein insertase Oxa1/YidC/SpoIIIJ
MSLEFLYVVITWWWIDFWNLLKFCLRFSLRVPRLSTLLNLGAKELLLVSLLRLPALLFRFPFLLELLPSELPLLVPVAPPDGV